MPMLPIALFKPTYLGNIKTPAIILPMDKFGEPFVVVENNGEPMACTLASGNDRFRTMPANGNEHWQGIAIERVTIELDTDSAASLTSTYLSPGAMVRSGTKLQLAAVANPQGFKSLVRLDVADGLPEGPEKLEVAFLKWRAVIREGDRVLFEYPIEAEQLDRPLP